MPLDKGTRLGPYEVELPLGAGAMGEVYRARDTRLGRDVAIKAISGGFANDPERLARFEREAQILASLNHPAIAAIYGLEEHDAARYLVLEYVPGETLAERLAGRASSPAPLPIDEALQISKQLAEALEAAHDKGIVHRDLKPANIKITPEGKVKVLDFGLAKDVGAVAAASGSGPTEIVVTLSSPGYTRAGMILGTAAYMSPEQARGKPVDKRSDIWAFGCILYECLTGKQPFGGETVSDRIAATLGRDPDWSALPQATPASVCVLLRRCLEKDASRRLRDAGDARLELEDAASGGLANSAGAAATVPAHRSAAWRRALPWGIAGLFALAAAWMAWQLKSAVRPAAEGMRATLPLPKGVLLPAGNPAVAVSPDGSGVVFVGAGGRRVQLYLRKMNEAEATPLAGSDGASAPFFSPDGKWLGFFGAGKLKKLPAGGGAAVVLDPKTVAFLGAASAGWAADDSIVHTFGVGDAVSTLRRVSASGGVATEIVRAEQAGNSLRWPHVLPGGRGLVFTHWAGSISSAQVFFANLDGTNRRPIAQGSTFGRYAASGHLVVAREGVLLAARFDPGRAEVSGPFVPVLEGVAMTPFGDAAQFAFSDTGTLVYVAGESDADSAPALAWKDRKGNEQPIVLDKRRGVQLALSSDAKRLAMSVREDEADVWIGDLSRGSLTRLTFAAGEDETPQWSPDANRIAYTSSRTGRPRLVQVRKADGTGAEEELWTSENHIHLSCWSADGKWLLFEEIGRETGWDVWALPLEGERKARRLLGTPFNERSAVLSPNGRWLAYVSDETGGDEVYVRSFAALSDKFQVSTNGGRQPKWSPGGDALFYVSATGLMSARVQPGAAFQAAAPRVVFDEAPAEYCVAPGGERFLLHKRQEQRGLNQLQVITRWFAELQRRVP